MEDPAPQACAVEGVDWQLVRLDAWRWQSHCAHCFGALRRARARCAVCREVERFDRRGIEPFELFTSEFGKNSLRIEEILLEFSRNPKNSGMVNILL